MNSIYKYKYWILFGLTIVSLSVSPIKRFENTWTEGFFLNIGAGFFCTMVVSLIIDESIKRQKKILIENKRLIINEHLRRIIIPQIRLFTEMYEAASENEINITDLNEFLNNEFIQQVIYLDMNIKVAQRNEDINWCTYIDTEFKEFSRHINGCLDRYWDSMEQDILTYVNKLLDSAFLSTLKNIMAIVKTASDNEFKHSNILGQLINYHMIHDYMMNLTTLIDMLNRKLPQEESIEFVSFKFPIIYARTKDLEAIQLLEMKKMFNHYSPK